MNLPTIEMPRSEARKHFLEYRRAVRERHNDEDAAIMRGYRELARGHQMLQLTDAMRLGGTTEFTFKEREWDHRTKRSEMKTKSITVPRLAIAHADSTAAWTFGVNENGAVEIRGKREVGHSNVRDRMHFPNGTFEPGRHEWRGVPRIRAIVPTVPPALRPAHALRNYHILWEAEWGLDPKAPVDPALLKHMGGDLYAVLAVWDLTEIERAVLGGRVPE